MKRSHGEKVKENDVNVHCGIGSLKRWLALGLLLVVVVGVLGCRAKVRAISKTYPVHGKVTFKDGKPLTEGAVQFQPEQDPYVTTASPVGPDGSYSLSSFGDGHQQAKGAVPGPNRVLVTIVHSSPASQPGGATQSGVSMVTLPKPFIVEPGDNEINLTLP